MTDLYTSMLNQIKKDPDQYAAFKTNKNTVVKAGPGSGKTTVLTLKIMNLLHGKIHPPRGLACITFSNEATKEFTKRLKVLGYQKRPNVVLSTVHSFCISEIIIPFSHLVSNKITLPLNIIKDRDRRELFQEIIDDSGFQNRPPTLTEMDKERNQLIGNDSNVEIESNEDARMVAIKYEKRLMEKGQVDFVEIIKKATQIIKEQPYVRRCLEAKFRWILIDEYQDLGKPLHEMVLTLCQQTNINFFAVGDPDQSIYGFQGSVPDYLLEIYNNDSFTKIELRTNYRSNQDIVDLSTMILNIDDREYISGTRQGEKGEIHFVTCESEMAEQYQEVVQNIIPKCINENIPLEEICVLAGRGKEMKELSIYMNKYNIPFYLAKYDFMKSNIILWLRDCALWLLEDSTITFDDLINFWLGLDADISEEKRACVTRELYLTLYDSKRFKTNLFEWYRFIQKELCLKQKVIDSNRFKNDIEIIEGFEKLIENGELKGYGLVQFASLGKPNGQVTLSTRHSSKGLEFEVVIILGLEDGNFPKYKSKFDIKILNEERRLFFVCLTRAKRACYLLRSRRITSETRSGLRTHDKKPSVFWEELIDGYEIVRQ